MSAPTRYIRQISACGTDNTRGTQCNVVCFALCNDGMVLFSTDFGGWHEMSEIPQPEVKDFPL